MLTAIEAMRAATTLPLAAMPNAGMPRAVEGRNIYLCSPEYMASFARKAIAAGAQIVGGCCGTTPNHIRAMRSAIRAIDEQAHVEGTGAAPAISRETPPAPLAQRSRLGSLIAEGKFVTLVEIVPPRGIDCSKEIEGAQLLARLGVHAINVYDAAQASARMSGQSLCIQIQQHTGMETILHYTCRDRNILSIQSDLLGASSIGLRNILCVTGDPPKQGNYPDATAVFDVDSIGLVNIVRAAESRARYRLELHRREHELHHRRGGQPRRARHRERAAAVCLQSGGGRGVRHHAAGLRPAPAGGVSGADQDRMGDHRIPVIAGIWPLTSLRNAEYMKNDLRVSMPEEIMLRMAQADTPEAARAEGIKIAQEMLEAVRPYVQGVQVSAPFGNYEAAAEVIASVLPPGK